MKLRYEFMFLFVMYESIKYLLLNYNCKVRLRALLVAALAFRVVASEVFDPDVATEMVEYPWELADFVNAGAAIYK